METNTNQGIEHKLIVDDDGVAVGIKSITQQTRPLGNDGYKVRSRNEAIVGDPNGNEVAITAELAAQLKDPENPLTISDLIVADGVAQVDPASPVLSQPASPPSL